MKQTLIVFVQDEPGVLNRVSSYIRRKNFNIESISAGQTEKQGITRITLVLNEPNKTKQNIVASSLKQLVDVYDVTDATKIKSHIREYVLIKIKLNRKKEKEFYEIIDQHNHNIISSENEIKDAVSSAHEFLNGANLVVNCAGVIGAARALGRDGPMPLDFFTRTIEINLIE